MPDLQGCRQIFNCAQIRLRDPARRDLAEQRGETESRGWDDEGEARETTRARAKRLSHFKLHTRVKLVPNEAESSLRDGAERSDRSSADTDTRKPQTPREAHKV